MIDRLKSEEVNLVSLEDPVEYHIDGICQVQINDKTGLTFASVLRSVLRQDPDIIAVGEIRDGETAEIAMRAGLQRWEDLYLCNNCKSSRCIKRNP